MFELLDRSLRSLVEIVKIVYSILTRPKADLTNEAVKHSNII